ncbi:TolC family outer membrane protein [Albimonas sp. CAU 1670]|uniref:TolC family outer membrane protein n=1 Tax=Albimonas sp. CAU 1670 TaxID=3032599 RepID=UPI0023D9DE74|nr:TolC family outer membrane protein [Albimonas sp. CAU 1670]MDF2232785.1 TolC family outer membrane protein [Albimonas sp. CAU 1670]
MTSKPLGLATALCALLALAGPLQAESLADAMAKAYANHPGLAAQRAALRGLDEAEYQARAQAYGTVNLQADYGWQNTDVQRSLARPRSRDDADPLDLGLQGSIPLYTGGQIENNAEAALQAVESGRSTLTSAEQSVLLAAVTAFEDVRRDIALVGVARSNVRVIGEQLKAAQDRFEVGEVTRTDVAQAESRLAASRSTLAAITGQLARSRQAYLAAVGEPAGELETPPPLPPLPESEAAAIALAEAQHPDLIAARFDARQAEFQVKAAIGRSLPQVSLNGSAGYSDDSVFIDDIPTATDSNAVSVGVTASMPLWTGGRNASAVRQAQANYARAMALIQNTGRSVRQDVSNSWSGLSVARASITAARQQIKASQIAFDGVREEATLGARTTLDVLDAEQELASAKADLIAALRDEYVAGYNLLASVGALTVTHLGLDVTPYDPDLYRTGVINEDPYGYPRGEETTWAKSYRP